METSEQINAQTNAASTLPPHAVMMQFIHSKVICRCLSAAAELGVADLLKDGPVAVEKLAVQCDVKSEPLARIIRALNTVQIFALTPNNEVANTPLSETLISDAPGSLRSFARWVGTHLHWDTMAHLDYSLKTGKSALIRNEPDGDPFDVMSRDKPFQAIFNEAMTGLSLADGTAIVDSYDFSQFKSVMDVGGGKGALADFIANSAPNVEVSVYDLPHVVNETEKRIREMNSRIHVKKGNFFESIPGPVDLIVMKHILHDWDDEYSAKILNNCHNAIDDTGKLLICEMLVTDDPGGIAAKIVDIDMLVGPGGKERSYEQFGTLLRDCGFRLANIIPTQSSIFLIEATKI